MSNDKLPKDADGLQLNFCKTLACDNFGLSDAEHYVLQHVNPKRPTMVCRECGAFPPLLNNQEVLNELQRLRRAHSEDLPACRNPECEYFGLSVHSHKQLYHAFGYSGDRQRYRCKNCHSTFVDKWSGTNPKITLQKNLLALLFTGYSVREICRKLAINPKTFYDHVDHIASRCRRKLAMFDARWMKYAQHYQFASHFMPLQPHSDNGVLWFSTGDARSGYVLTQHINYAADIEPEGSLDHDPYQIPARFVHKLYQPESNLTIQDKPRTLREKIDLQYQRILARSNVEDPMGNMSRFNYPAKGALIRAPYTSYAHYLHILSMCREDKRVSIFMPQDPLLRSAALSICLDRIRKQNVDLLYVEEDKGWDDNQQPEKIDIVHMGWWRDRWAVCEQQKASKGVCLLAGDSEQTQYWLHTASIKNVSLYQQRFQLMFDGFINEPRRKLRPGGILPLLDIYRAWHNLCYQDKSGLTPAQKLCLTDQPMPLKQLLS